MNILKALKTKHEAVVSSLIGWSDPRPRLYEEALRQAQAEQRQQKVEAAVFLRDFPSKQRVCFDMEFMEDGERILPLSLGAVRGDGATFYAVFEHDPSIANEWVKANVLPKLGDSPRLTRAEVAEGFAEFCGDSPEFWADYGAYDWVCLCQMYGTMMDLPKGWPMFVRDAQQAGLKVRESKVPHHALEDAKALASCAMQK